MLTMIILAGLTVVPIAALPASRARVAHLTSPVVVALAPPYLIKQHAIPMTSWPEQAVDSTAGEPPGPPSALSITVTQEIVDEDGFVRSAVVSVRNMSPARQFMLSDSGVGFVLYDGTDTTRFWSPGRYNMRYCYYEKPLDGELTPGGGAFVLRRDPEVDSVPWTV